MGVSENDGTQQPWCFLLKMTILGCFGGTTILGNTHIYIDTSPIDPSWENASWIMLFRPRSSGVPFMRLCASLGR